jgi:hypothetical protein
VEEPRSQQRFSTPHQCSRTPDPKVREDSRLTPCQTLKLALYRSFRRCQSGRHGPGREKRGQPCILRFRHVCEYQSRLNETVPAHSGACSQAHDILSGIVPAPEIANGMYEVIETAEGIDPMLDAGSATPSTVAPGDEDTLLRPTADLPTEKL